jgi:hypothetical protein
MRLVPGGGVMMSTISDEVDRELHAPQRRAMMHKRELMQRRGRLNPFEEGAPRGRSFDDLGTASLEWSFPSPVCLTRAA